jgi:hypothetical protein
MTILTDNREVLRQKAVSGRNHLVGLRIMSRREKGFLHLP